MYENPSRSFAQISLLFTRGKRRFDRMWCSVRCVCIPKSDTLGLQRFFVIDPRGGAGIGVHAERAFLSQFGGELQSR